VTGPSTPNEKKRLETKAAEEADAGSMFSKSFVATFLAIAYIFRATFTIYNGSQHGSG